LLENKSDEIKNHHVASAKLNIIGNNGNESTYLIQWQEKSDVK